LSREGDGKGKEVLGFEVEIVDLYLRMERKSKWGTGKGTRDWRGTYSQETGTAKPPSKYSLRSEIPGSHHPPG